MEPKTLNDFTLQNLCLSTIARNLDIFCNVFRSNTKCQLYLEFIQKCYSHRILQHLVEGCLMKDRYLPIVINKYTKELDFRNISMCDFDAILKILKEFGNVIQKFSMVSIKPFYSYDEVLSYLPNVQTIDLQYTNCSDESVICIADHCHNLKSLDLYFCAKVSDRGLMYLAEKKLPLENLNLKGTTVTFKGVASVLKNIPKIQTLWFNNVPRAIFEALGLNDAVAEIPKGKVFSLTNIVIVNKPMRPEAHLTTTLEACLSLCPLIEDLTVTEIINEKQLNLCSSFKELKTVNLQCSFNSIRTMYINDFLEIRGDKIHSLTLMNFSLTVQVLVNSCPNLKQLTLEFPSFQNIPKMQSVRTLMHLKTFNLQNTVLDSEEIIKSISAIIAVCPNLEQLNFRVCQFIDKIYDIILRYPEQLTDLSFGSTAIDAAFLENVLRKHKNLTGLYLDNSGITTDEYDDLMDFVDTMTRTVNVRWTDYNEAIKELYSRDFDTPLFSRTVIKL